MTAAEPARRIALVHGVAAAIAPAEEAVRAEFPDADVWNLLDDRLIEEVHARGSVTPELQARMRRLIDHAFAGGADAVLITCSLYSFMAQQEPVHVVVGADEAAFSDAVAARPDRIVVVASVPEALDDAVTRLSACVEVASIPSEIVPLLVEDAAAAAKRGDSEAMGSLIADRLTPLTAAGDVVLFAQYSLAPAAAAVAERVPVPVITGPARAAREIRVRLGGPRRTGS